MLGVSVAVVSFLFGLIGWHQAYEMSFVFLVIAILLNVTAVVRCLRERQSEDAWGAQILNGLVLGAVASVIIFFTSWLVTAAIFPEYFAEMAEGYRQTFVDMGLSDAEVEDMVSATAATSPIRSAIDGVIGTMATSLVVAAIAGFWFRKKD